MIKLLCIPYAGGSATMYSAWKRHLNPAIEIMELELPGHGRRLVEPLYTHFDNVYQDMLQNVIHNVSNRQFAIFGHSMGSVLAYELAIELTDKYGLQPIHVFASGAIPPHIRRSDLSCHNLEDDQLIRKILLDGGTPAKVFEDSKMRDIFLPIIKADYMVLDSYYCLNRKKMNCNLSIMNGCEDVDIDDSEAIWKSYTTQNCDFVSFPGGHFYIQQCVGTITEYINKILVGERGM